MGLGEEIQLTDALPGSLESPGLNAVEADAQIFRRVSKLGFLSANLAVGVLDPELKRVTKRLFDESGV